MDSAFARKDNPHSKDTLSGVRFLMSFIHLPQITGCVSTAALLYDICRRMPMNGGADYGGHHWIYLSAQEASGVLKCARNTAARYLRLLVEAGFLIREKLGIKEGFKYRSNRSWYYRPGPKCPDWLLGNDKRKEKAHHCSKAGQSTKPTSLPNYKNRATSGKKQPRRTPQPPVKPEPRMNIPDADQTASILAEIEAWPDPQPPSRDAKDAILNRLQHPPVQTDQSLDEIRAACAEAQSYALSLQRPLFCN